MAKMILIVDDDANIRRTLTDILVEYRYRVIEAASAEEGLKRAKTENPDLILLDLMMPELDGIAAVLKLKGSAETKSIPIIICTAVNGSEDEIVAQSSGVVDYITKPYQIEDVIAKIERALNK